MPGFQPRLAPTMWSVARIVEAVEMRKMKKMSRWAELDMVMPCSCPTPLFIDEMRLLSERERELDTFCD